MQIDLTPKEAAAIVATVCGTFDSDDVEKVIFVVKRRCPRCRYPHIITAFGTAVTDMDAIEMLSHATARIVAERPFGD